MRMFPAEGCIVISEAAIYDVETAIFDAITAPAIDTDTNPSPDLIIALIWS